jgi:hypothetical protein
MTRQTFSMIIHLPVLPSSHEISCPISIWQSPPELDSASGSASNLRPGTAYSVQRSRGEAKDKSQQFGARFSVCCFCACSSARFQSSKPDSGLEENDLVTYRSPVVALQKQARSSPNRHAQSGGRRSLQRYHFRNPDIAVVDTNVGIYRVDCPQAGLIGSLIASNFCWRRASKHLWVLGSWAFEKAHEPNTFELKRASPCADSLHDRRIDN